jgi:ubiquinone/menaquinone biosynthesis C-methylase UbiE
MRLLVYAGLQPDHSLVDIGCGSGRLAVQLADWLRGPYLGTDVVQSLLDQAAQTCSRPD